MDKVVAIGIGIGIGIGIENKGNADMFDTDTEKTFQVLSRLKLMTLGS